MSSRTKTRKEGEAVAMKSVRKHQLRLAVELKRLKMERLVTERYYRFERALVQRRFNRLVTRQKELGIYKPGSPLKKSINLPNCMRSKKSKKTSTQPFFVTTATLGPRVNIGKHQFLPRTTDYYKKLINKELNTLQGKIQQFNNFNFKDYKKGETILQGPSHLEKTLNESLETVANAQNLKNSSYSVQNEKSSNKKSELQQNLRTNLKTQVLPAVPGQDASNNNLQTPREQTPKLPAINNSNRISSNESNTKKVRRNLKNSKVNKAKTSRNKFQKPREINSSAENTSRDKSNMATGKWEGKMSSEHPTDSLQELENKMGKLDLQADKILSPEQSERPQTVRNDQKKMAHIDSVSTLTTSLRPQSVH